MPTNITGIGTSWNLPNYAGELFSSDQKRTPFLSMIGGLTGGKRTQTTEFITGQQYNLPTAKQPDISEQASVTAPPAVLVTREQETNVVQIFHETVEMTYHKLAAKGQLGGLNAAGQNANPADDWSWQVAQKLITIARDVEHTFINGNYRRATAVNVADKTRGMLELAATVNAIDASSTALSKELIKTIAKEMTDNGAYLGNMVLFTGSNQRQRITDIYESKVYQNAPPAKIVGGVSVVQLLTDFFEMGVIYDPYVPEDTILIADVSACAPVFMEVPGKGVLFEEELPRSGANKRSQIYGEIGLDHGPAFLHGVIKGLATN